MTVLETAKKMIDYSHGNLHDINHFMKVYAYAKMIADGEQLDPDTQKLVDSSGSRYCLPALSGKIWKYERQKSGKGKCCFDCRIF